jgi:hypothetical protein
LNQFPILPGVEVYSLNDTVLWRKFFQNLVLCPAKHKPLAPQVITELIRIFHNVVAIPITPFAGETLPIAQAVILDDVHNRPHFAAPVMDRRTGKPYAIRRRCRQQGGRAVLLRPGMPQLLYLVKDDSLEAVLL